MIFELLLLILVWSVLSTVLQYGNRAKPWFLMGLALFAAAFCYAVYPIAIEQSIPVLKKLPQDPLWLQRITVIILAEVLLRWIVVNASLRSALGYAVNKRWQWFGYVPLPSLPVALFLFQVMLFYADTDVAFDTLALGYAASMALGLLLLGLILRRLLPNRVQRLELAQVLLMITAVTACLLSVSVQFDQLGDTADKVADYHPFVVLSATVLFVGVLGYIWTKIKIKRNGFFK